MSGPGSRWQRERKKLHLQKCHNFLGCFRVTAPNVSTEKNTMHCEHSRSSTHNLALCRNEMSSITGPLLLPQYASGPFDWANTVTSSMRGGALQLLSQPFTAVSDFLHQNEAQSDRGHMGCVHPGRAQHSVIDDEGYVITEWKGSSVSSQAPQHVDSAHIINHNPAGVPYTQQRDGAHILSSWTDQSVVSSSASPEEDVPMQMEPTPLCAGKRGTILSMLMVLNSLHQVRSVSFFLLPWMQTRPVLLLAWHERILL